MALGGDRLSGERKWGWRCGEEGRSETRRPTGRGFYGTSRSEMGPAFANSPLLRGGRVLQSVMMPKMADCRCQSCHEPWPCMLVVAKPVAGHLAAGETPGNHMLPHGHGEPACSIGFRHVRGNSLQLLLHLWLLRSPVEGRISYDVIISTIVSSMDHDTYIHSR